MPRMLESRVERKFGVRCHSSLSSRDINRTTTWGQSLTADFGAVGRIERPIGVRKKGQQGQEGFGDLTRFLYVCYSCLGLRMLGRWALAGESRWVLI